ncbi:MAG TPA: FAD-dependent oxidoreductase [Candidatus Eremiobacteraceae bacterium]|nr:FAD-dependent oxidoreductase [Candidatus Eremiobacteraceae bacterium]
MTAQAVDAIVIGSGQGGVPFAADLAREGKQVVLFERGRLGGSCINYGCTPSKAFLAAAHSAGRARRAQVLGVDAQVHVDFPAVMERVRMIRDDFMHRVGQRLEQAGVKVVHAQASFSGERTVTGGDRTFTAPLVVIDTGTTAFVPGIDGLAGTPYLTNETFFDLTALPRRLLVLGGGYIGLELGQGMARAGAEVHIVDRNARVLSREEPEASTALESSLHEDGVYLHLGPQVSRVEHSAQGFALTLDTGQRLEGDALLVAIGRTPNSGALDCAAGGVELDAQGMIVTDRQLRTTAAGVYAIGDVAGQPAFTHVSWEDYRRLKDITAGGTRTRDDRVLAYTTFTEPQVARVGFTLDEALAKDFDARCVTYEASWIARAIEWGQTSGFYRLVVDKKTDRILGATMVGYEAGELIHVILAHMEAGSTWQVLERSVHIHPTYAEALPSLARMLA